MPSSYQPCSFFLCTEKFLELEIPILCLLCFVCLFMKNCRDFGQRTLAPIPWGLFMFIARYCLTPGVLLLFFFLDPERNGKNRFEIPRGFTASSAQNSRNAFKGIVFRDKERVCVPITSGYPGYQRSFSRVGLDAFVGRRPTELPPFFSAAE